MAIALRDTVKINEFINLSKTEEILPAMFTRMKSVRISTVDKVVAKENDSVSEVDLLKGVKLVKNGYVNLVGLVVSGEWNLPDNCRGGVSVCLVDRRMTRHSEATLGSYTAPACKKNFSFKLIPNYSVTTADAERRPWEVMVNIKGVAMAEGWCPLTLEFVCVCIVHKTNVRTGLREKVTSVSEGSSIELTEDVVDEFFESVPMARRLQNLRNRRGNINRNKFQVYKKKNKNNIGDALKERIDEVKDGENKRYDNDDYSIEESSDSY
uniref:Movement protein n=1 Tax=Yellow tailflower mild mottle virus TaxID=1416026 RepID=A0A0F6P0Q6_9VIRU|nr:movement protein [Yellow tailflower mild mottle virus]